MKKTVITITTIGLLTLLGGNEPSVYGAGDIDSAQPYGLTTTEKGVLNNRKAIQNLKNRVSEQQNRIDGLITIIEGLNKEIVSLKERLKTVSDNKENKKIRDMLLELGQMVDQINNNYVTQEDLKEALRRGTVTTTSSTLPPITSNSSTTSSFDVSDIYRQGVQLFGKKNYQMAKEKFEESLSYNYKPAPTNYYLGEIAYYTHEYADAIEYYKKSASIYDKASYMKTLYLHTGISLFKIGQKDQARGFFKFVIDNYPNTKVSEIAKRYM